MSEQLKPCPFCGGEVLKTGGDDKVVGVWCLNCQCTGPNHYGGHEWNDRTDLSLAHAAVMIEKAAQVCDPEVPCTRENKPSRDADISELFAWEVGHLAQKDAAEIRALINTDAQAALDEYVRGKAEAERDRLREASTEVVKILWEAMSRQEDVGPQGGYIYMQLRAALKETDNG